MTDGLSREDRTEAAGLKVLGVLQGDPRRAMSGVAGHLFDALSRRCDVVGALDYQVVGVARLALWAATFRPRRGDWKRRFHFGRFAHDVRSARLAKCSRDAVDFDVAVQVHGWALHQPRPYVPYIDQTRLMAERGWPPWMPIGRRERDAILDRERRMYALAGHVFVMSEAARTSLIEDYETPPQRISVVGGGLNLPGLPEARDVTAEPVILFVGREFERKGGDLLLRAFAAVRETVPGATLHVVGPRRRVRERGVISHGSGSRSKVTDLYRRARVFCMPSRYEPYGLVFAEAMAHGVPCVGTDVQAIPGILGHGEAGVIVPPDDAEALAATLCELLTDDALARRLGEAGRARVEAELTWEHVAARMEPVLLEVARNPARRD